MSKGKSYNRIVFLTTLSVYLGLVLVGGTAPVSAQQAVAALQNTEKNKVSILEAGSGFIFTFDLNPIIELNRLASSNSETIEISGTLVPLPEKVSDWKITNSAGNQEIINFLHKEFFSPLEGNATVSPLFPKAFYQSVEVDKNYITLKRNLTFNSAQKAVETADFFQRLYSYAKSSKAEKEISGNLLLTNSQVRVENNQVFIVTHLPRAAIDEFPA